MTVVALILQILQLAGTSIAGLVSTDKTAAEIRALAAQKGLIKNIDVIISPYWRDRTPQDVSRIKLVIQ